MKFSTDVWKSFGWCQSHTLSFWLSREGLMKLENILILTLYTISEVISLLHRLSKKVLTTNCFKESFNRAFLKFNKSCWVHGPKMNLNNSLRFQANFCVILSNWKQNLKSYSFFNIRTLQIINNEVWKTKNVKAFSTLGWFFAKIEE